jgi:hypothetical protein
MNRWARKYVGRPHAKAPDGNGPVRYSCWGLVRAAARERMSIELPPINIDGDAPSEHNFTLLLRAARQTGLRPLLAREARADDIVVMYGVDRLHCGYVVVENGRVKVLHSAHERGVVCDSWADATAGMQAHLWRRAAAGKGEPLMLAGVPQDREDLKGLARTAAVLAANFYGGPFAALATTWALNALLPPTVPTLETPPTLRSPTDTGTSFSTSLSGNAARLDEPIWKVCGRKEITPPFAAQPYYRYVQNVDEDGDPVDPDIDRDQYLYALYAVGIGEHDLISAKLGNTPISRFADVLVARYLAPGVAPTDVLPNVTTAPEVSNQALDTGRYVGGFAICAARRTATDVEIDVMAPRGLGKGVDPLTVEWKVEAREINDFGQVLGAWAVLGTESREAYTSTPQRWTDSYELPAPGRYEVRVVRTDVQDTDAGALHELTWIGLRAILSDPAPLNEHTAYFELVMRASSQLSAGSSRDLRLILQAHCRSLDADLEFVAEAYTRNPMWWLLDLCTSSTWGLNKPASRVDLQSIYDLAQTCDARQDRFDYVFDSSMSAWDAMQLIARTCRARVFRRNDVISVARDELSEIPVTAFTPRNCSPGMAINETLRRRKSPDGVIVEYQDYRTNEWTQIECPMPGVSPTDMERPIRMRLPGITGPTHAEREGLYEAASMLYRTRTCSWTTEMQGLLPAFMSPVDFLPDTQGYGRSGDVEAWDVDTLTMTLTEPPDWTQAPLFLTLIRDDGTCHDPLEVEQGDTAFEVVLPEAPDFELVIDDGGRERPKYLIGRKELVKVSGIADGGRTDEGAQMYALRGVIDDERVHEVDVALLPGSGEIQDEPLNPDDAGEGGSDVIVSFYSDTVLYRGTDVETLANMYARIAFGNDGVLINRIGSDAVPSQDEHIYANQWVLAGAVPPTTADDFEIRFEVVTTVDPTGNCVLGGATLATWLSLGTTRQVTWNLADGETDLELGEEAYVVVRCQIRDVATEIIQQDRNMTLKLTRI